MTNRGVLGHWGANHTSDFIVTRRHPKKNTLEMVAVLRDSGEWAIPGGMNGAIEVTSSRPSCSDEAFATVMKRYLRDTHAGQAEERVRLLQLFEGGEGRVVFMGYVDDPRNTDNAWTETVATHFHCDDAQRAAINFEGAKHVRWLEVGPHNPDYLALYASHRQIVDSVASFLLNRAVSLQPGKAAKEPKRKKEARRKAARKRVLELMPELHCDGSGDGDGEGSSPSRRGKGRGRAKGRGLRFAIGSNSSAREKEKGSRSCLRAAGQGGASATEAGGSSEVERASDALEAAIAAGTLGEGVGLTSAAVLHRGGGADETATPAARQRSVLTRLSASAGRGSEVRQSTALRRIDPRDRLDWLADFLLEVAAAEEVALTSTVQRLAAAAGGQLVDTRHAFKGRTSIVRKAREFARRAGIEAEQKGLPSSPIAMSALVVRRNTLDCDAIQWAIVDVLRYTVRFPTAPYVSDVKSLREAFRGAGIIQVDTKNFWVGEQLYVGVNDVFAVRTARMPFGRFYFEVQSHTAESHASKLATHPVYAAERTSADVRSKYALQQQLLAMTNPVPRPEGIETLPTVIQRPRLTLEDAARQSKVLPVHLFPEKRGMTGHGRSSTPDDGDDEVQDGPAELEC